MMTLCRIYFLLIGSFIWLVTCCSEPLSLRQICLENICANVIEYVKLGTSFKEVFEKLQNDLEQLPKGLSKELRLQLSNLIFPTIFPQLKILSHKDEITSLNFHPQHNILVSTGRDKRIKWINIDENKGHNDPSGPLVYNGLQNKEPLVLTVTLASQFTEDGTYLTGTETGQIGLKEMGKNFSYYSGATDRHIIGICKGCDKSDILIATTNKLLLYNTQTKIWQSLGIFINKEITSITSSPKYNLCAIGFDDGTIDIYQDYARILEFSENNTAIIYLHLFNDKLFAADREGNAISWTPDENDKRSFSIKTFSTNHVFSCYTVSPNEMLQAFSDENKLYITDIMSDKDDHYIKFTHTINHLAFNYNSTLLAASDFQGNVYFCPLPKELISLNKLLFLLFFNTLKITQTPVDHKTIKQLLKMIKNEQKMNKKFDIKPLFTPTMLAIIKDQLKVLKRQKKKKRYTDTAKKILRLGSES